jgi:hypothetical protein
MGHLRCIITGGCDFCDRLKTNERNDGEWDYRNAAKQTDSKIASVDSETFVAKIIHLLQLNSSI